MAPPPGSAARIAEAKEVSKNNASKAETIYKDVLSKAPGSNEQALRDYENALVGLGELYRDNKKVDELAELVKSSRSTLSSFAKAKTAKLGQDHLLYLQEQQQQLTKRQSGSSSTSSETFQSP